MTSRPATAVDIDQAPDRPTVVWLSNGLIRLGVVPQLGGRLLSATTSGREALWRNPSLLDVRLHPVHGHTPSPAGGQLGDWKNYGGDKTWPAPQGWSGPSEWAGPPDPVLDSGPYSWQVDHDSGAAAITMVSRPDPRTGLQLTRSITLPPASSAWDTVLSARNTSSVTTRWALWNITQCPGGDEGTGGVFIGMEPGLHRTVEIVSGTGVPRCESFTPTVVRVPHQRVVGKLGFPSAGGWLAHVGGHLTTSVTFEVDPSAEYPDQGSRVEVWLEHPLDQPLPGLGGLQPTASIVEIEVLGPLTDLEPGRQTSLTLRTAISATPVPDVIAADPSGHVSSDGTSETYQRAR